MARQLQMSRTTVIRYLRTSSLPERAQSRRVSLLDPYVAYVHKRWEEGCRKGVQLRRDIQTLGFPGTR
jgi:transposase